MGAARPSETLRAFVALGLDSMSTRRIARLAEHLKMASGAPSATWTPSAKYHITLRFFGSLPQSAAEPLGAALAPLAEGQTAPRPGALRLDAFPSVLEASAIIVGFDDVTGDLAKLAEQTQRIGLQLGLPKERREFRPHVTLARLKRPYDARRWLRPEWAPAVGECRPSHIALYRSHLEPESARYEPLARFDYRAST